MPVFVGFVAVCVNCGAHQILSSGNDFNLGVMASLNEYSRNLAPWQPPESPWRIAEAVRKAGWDILPVTGACVCPVCQEAAKAPPLDRAYGDQT